VVGIVAGLVAVACSGGGGSSAKPAPKPTVGSVDLAAGPVTVASAGAQVALPDTVRDQVLGALKRYVQTATITPLQTGKPAGDLAPVFTADAVARAQGSDRGVLVDEGLPKATGDVVAKAPPVALTGLADGSGTIVLVDATLALTVDTETGRGPVKIQRNGDLVFAPDAGSWKVLGFDLQAARSGKGIDAVVKTAPSTRAAP
jgi:hypothetical protein